MLSPISGGASFPMAAAVTAPVAPQPSAPISTPMPSVFEMVLLQLSGSTDASGSTRAATTVAAESSSQPTTRLQSGVGQPHAKAKTAAEQSATASSYPLLPTTSNPIQLLSTASRLYAAAAALMSGDSRPGAASTAGHLPGFAAELPIATAMAQAQPAMSLMAATTQTARQGRFESALSGVASTEPQLPQADTTQRLPQAPVGNDLSGRAAVSSDLAAMPSAVDTVPHGAPQPAPLPNGTATETSALASGPRTDSSFVIDGAAVTILASQSGAATAAQASTPGTHNIDLTAPNPNPVLFRDALVAVSTTKPTATVRPESHEQFSGDQWTDDLADLIKQQLDEQDGDAHVHLALDLPDIGSIGLDLKLSQGVVSIRITVSSPQAIELISSRLDDLRQALTRQGVTCDSFEVAYDANPQAPESRSSQAGHDASKSATGGSPKVSTRAAAYQNPASRGVNFVA